MTNLYLISKVIIEVNRDQILKARNLAEIKIILKIYGQLTCDVNYLLSKLKSNNSCIITSNLF
jgi:hypothetical protein